MTITAALHAVDRVSNSANGNPRYRVSTSAGAWFTDRDNAKVIQAAGNVDATRLPATARVRLSDSAHRHPVVVDMMVAGYSPERDAPRR